MTLNRRIDSSLSAWRRQSTRKPMILRGARQTGKTTSVRSLGGQFRAFLEVNLERIADRRLLESAGSATECLRTLRARAGVSEADSETLLFLDEIQESSVAVRMLRFLHEDHPELAVVGAGSLLEVRLREAGFSFPVGRVTFLYVAPMTFLEFLDATGDAMLAEQLRSMYSGKERPPESLHLLAMERLRLFLRVGGMPEAVQTWCETADFVAVGRVHEDLLLSFEEDIPKYRRPREAAPIEAAFAALPRHFGARFKYENFAPGQKSRAMKAALDKLEGAMLLSRALPTTSTTAPAMEKVRAAPKLIPLDIGLALRQLGVRQEELQSAPMETLAGGRIAESFVGIQLRDGEVGSIRPLFFWVREQSSGTAEVDFLLARGLQFLPVEVKSGSQGRLRSLHHFLHRAGGDEGIRLSSAAGGIEQHEVCILPSRETLRYQLHSLPLYLAERLVQRD